MNINESTGYLSILVSLNLLLALYKNIATFWNSKFTVQGSVHRKYIPFDIFTTRCNITQFIYFWKTALHVSGGISTHHQEHTQLYLQYLVLVKPLLLPAATVLNWFECSVGIVLFRYGCWRESATVPKKYKVPDTVKTVVCAPDDGWRYHPKHVEQFSRNK